MNQKPKRIAKRVFSILCLLVLSPFLYKGAINSLPYLNAAAGQLAVWSAGITMPEGGKELLQQEITEDESSRAEEEEPSGEVSLPASESPAVTAGTAGEEEQSASSEQTPVRPDDAGNIVRRQYTGSASSTQFQIDNNAWIKNLTTHTEAEIREQIAQGPAFQIEDTSEPQVLIMHTHTTEGYEAQSLDWYDKNYNSRTTDNAYNVCRVGDEIEKQLKEAGIGVIHDCTLHDYPTFPGCYDRSAVTVRNYLDQYPSIKVVLDIHRDAIEQQDGTRIAPVANINGKNAAQVMIISGCDDGTMGYPNYFQNLKFAAALQSQMEADYPGLARPLLFDYRKYNQHLTTGSILLEMGGHANSLEEAVYAGELVGKSLANLLKKL